MRPGPRPSPASLHELRGNPSKLPIDRMANAGLLKRYAELVDLHEQATAIVHREGLVSVNPDSGRQAAHPAATLGRGYAADLLKLEGELGLSPASRSSLGARAAEQAEDLFVAFVNGRHTPGTLAEFAARRGDGGRGMEIARHPDRPGERRYGARFGTVPGAARSLSEGNGESSGMPEVPRHHPCCQAFTGLLFYKVAIATPPTGTFQRGWHHESN